MKVAAVGPALLLTLGTLLTACAGSLPPTSYYTGSPDIHIGINFWEWIFPSVVIGRELWRVRDPAFSAKCDGIIQARPAPNDWQRSEWWAVAPR